MTLAHELELGLAAVRADPIDAVGLGDTNYLPYVLRHGELLCGGDDPAVTARLMTAASDPAAPRVERLALLQIVGLRGDASVDRALVDALRDPTLRPLSAYLLGRAGFKGYPRRARSARSVLAALREHLDDAGVFEDPWHQRSYLNQDLILAAFVRIASPERFDLSTLAVPRAAMIGYELAELDDASRASLRAQCRAADISALP